MDLAINKGTFTFSNSGTDFELSLLAAVEVGNLWEVEELLELMNLANYEIDHGHIVSKALISAANLGRTDIVRCLLENGADEVIDYTNDYGSTALLMASMRRHTDIMSLLIQAGCSVNSLDMQSRAAIHWCAINGDCGIIEELLENGSAADQPDNVCSSTPLMHAAEKGYSQIVELLLQHNCDVNTIDRYNNTPLFEACRCNKLSCVKLLLGAGADIDHADNKGCTALHVAVYYGRVEVVKLLVHYNCQLELEGALNRNGNNRRLTALEYATRQWDEQSFEILVQAGANLNKLYPYLTSSRKNNSVFENGQSVISLIRETLAKHPRTLKELTRIAIRKYCADVFLKVVNRLPLPKVLIEFLQIPELGLVLRM